MSLQPLTFPPKILAAPLAAAGTRLIMPDINHWDFDTSAATLQASEVGTVMYATLMDFAKTKMEIIELDPSTLTVATTTGILINKRACGFAGGTTASVETAYDWTPNETYVQLGSNPPQLLTDLVDLNEAQTITGVKTFDKDTGRPRISADEDTAVDEELVTFGQLARQAIAGAADASETVAGLVEEATQAEVDSGAAAGGVARLFVTPEKLMKHLQGQPSTYLVEDGTGSDDTYTTTATPTLTAYTIGQVFRVKLTVANTAAATLNIDSLGAKPIKKYVDGAIADIETGDIVANYVGLFEYDGTNFVLLSMSATTPTTAILSEMNTFFGSTDLTAAEAETLSSGVNSNAENLHKHPNYKAVVAKFTQSGGGGGAPSSQTNDGITYTVPANRLGATNGIRLSLFTEGAESGGSGSVGSGDITIKFGGSTIYTYTPSTNKETIELVIMNTSASAQDWGLHENDGGGGDWTSGTTAIDTTSDAILVAEVSTNTQSGGRSYSISLTGLIEIIDLS